MTLPPGSSRSPSQPRWSHGAASDVGNVRAVNEDSFVAAPTVLVVADGMGGHSGGDVASRLTVEEFDRLGGREFTPRTGRDAILESLVRAQSRLRRHVEGRPDEDRARHAGTTVVTALLVDGPDGPCWLVANVGDSRAYACRDGVLSQITRDHSVVQQLLDAGQISAEEALQHPERHVITRALSGIDVPEPDFFEVPLAQAPRLLLCSDGVSGLLDPATMAGLTGATATPQEVAESLVQASLAAGGTDNATAVVADVVG